MGVCCGHEVSVVPSQSVKYKGENILRHTMHTKVEVKMTDAFAATVKEQVSAYSAETKKIK